MIARRNCITSHHARPGWNARRWVRCTWLRWQIWSTAGYIRQCRADGICDSLSMREFDSQIEVMRVRLAVLEQR